MQDTRKKKLIVSGLFASLAITAVLGGTVAQLTDQGTTEAQALVAGTVAVSLAEGTSWDTANLRLAVGDTVARSVTVHNDGNLPIGAVTLSAAVADTPGSDPTSDLSDVVQVTIKQGATTLADGVPLSALTDYTLSLPAQGLAPGASMPLQFEYEVVGTRSESLGAGGRSDFSANPDNRYQGAALTVSYTVNAIQRPGLHSAAVAAPSGTATLLASGLGRTTSVAVGSDGYIYVPQTQGPGALYRISPQDGTRTVASPGGAMAASAVTADAEGYVYAFADIGSRLIKIGPTTRTSVWTHELETPAKALVYSAADDTIYAATSAGTVAAVDAGSGAMTPIVSGLTGISALTVDPAGILYAIVEGTVLSIDPLSGHSEAVRNDLGMVKGVVVANGYLYAITADGLLTRSDLDSGEDAAFETGLASINGLAFGNGKLYGSTSTGSVYEIVA